MRGLGTIDLAQGFQVVLISIPLTSSRRKMRPGMNVLIWGRVAWNPVVYSSDMTRCNRCCHELTGAVKLPSQKSMVSRVCTQAMALFEILVLGPRILRRLFPAPP
jgi:hypothetical protein